MKVIELACKKNKCDLENITGISLSELFDNLDDGVCIINKFGVVDYVNEAYKKYFMSDRYLQIGDSIFEKEVNPAILKCYNEKQYVRNIIDCYSKHFAEAIAWPVYYHGDFHKIIVMHRKLNDNKDDNKSFFMKTHKILSNKKIELEESFMKIVGCGRKMREALLIAQKASRTLSNVLITGESGTGKELVAKAIHYASDRADESFVVVNCGAIPSTLIESELFGHEQGAFTGAVKQKVGKFEKAHKGTVFLDEIGELPLEMQAKLLRVLQEKEFERVGGIDTIKVDIRIIAATNRDLEEMVKRGLFREDLYYRINVIPIYLSPLRERREDIPLLIDHFIEKTSAKLKKEPIEISRDAKECLINYDWPGNVRQLENVIERIIALNERKKVDIDQLPTNIIDSYKQRRQSKENDYLVNLKSNGDIATLEEYEREIIKLAIEKYGSFNAAGKALGITHKTVAHKARKYNIV